MYYYFLDLLYHVFPEARQIIFSAKINGIINQGSSSTLYKVEIGVQNSVPYLIDDVTAEYIYVVKSLCDKYKFSQDNLYQLSYSTTVEKEIDNNVRWIQSIPVLMDIPTQMAPTHGKSHLILDIKPNAKSDSSGNSPIGSNLCGLAEYVLKHNGTKTRFWRWAGYRERYPLGDWVYFVERKNLKQFYRGVITLQKRSQDFEPPILAPRMLKEIYDNSIGFLKNGKEHQAKYKEYNIPIKRGILLAGKPGSGKTLTCRWLRHLSIVEGFVTRIVTMQDYTQAEAHGRVHNLFSLPRNRSGIIFFDDMDTFVKRRDNVQIMTFLTEFDGIIPKEGIVNIFTTNELQELEEAFVRPGRIDLFLTFRSPSKKLKVRFVKEKFHQNILSLIDLNAVVEKSKNYTFAELEEIRKLLTIDYLNKEEVSVEKTFNLFELHRAEFAERAKMGFGMKEEQVDIYDDDEPIGLPSIPQLPFPCRFPSDRFR